MRFALVCSTESTSCPVLVIGASRNPTPAVELDAVSGSVASTASRHSHQTSQAEPAWRRAGGVGLLNGPMDKER
jgi:hypothetical protein